MEAKDTVMSDEQIAQYMTICTLTNVCTCSIIALDNSIQEENMEKKTTKVRTIRLPVELDTRIKVLAQKRLCSVNAWIVNTLMRESKPRNQS